MSQKQIHTYIFIDADQIETSSLKTCFSLYASTQSKVDGRKISVIAVCNDNDAVKTSLALDAALFGVNFKVVPSFKNAADMVICAMLGETVGHKHQDLNVILFSSDHALISAAKHLCQIKWVPFFHKPPIESTTSKFWYRFLRAGM